MFMTKLAILYGVLLIAAADAFPGRKSEANMLSSRKQDSPILPVRSDTQPCAPGYADQRHPTHPPLLRERSGDLLRARAYPFPIPSCRPIHHRYSHRFAIDEQPAQCGGEKSSRVDTAARYRNHDSWRASDDEAAGRGDCIAIQSRILASQGSFHDRVDHREADETSLDLVRIVE